MIEYTRPYLHRIAFAVVAASLGLAPAAPAKQSSPFPRTPCCWTPDPPAPLEPSAPTEVIVFGDFNGDGFQDAAFGMPSYAVDGVEDAGAVRTLYGSVNGLLADHPQVGTELLHLNLLGGDGAQPGDRFGAALAVGDFDGDGDDDLAVGVPGEDSELLENVGEVHVLFGSFNGLQTFSSQLLTIPPELYPGNDHGFGSALAAGDVLGSSASELLVGTPGFDDVAGNTIYEDTGAVGVYRGSPSGLSFFVAAGDPYRLLSSRPRFGSSLVVGDFDGNGEDDVAIGAPFAEPWGGSDAGTVTVFYNGLDGLPQNEYSSSALSQIPLRGRYESGDHFGWSLAVGDFDGNLVDDLAIGVPDEDVTVTTDLGTDQIHEHFANAGAVNVVYGSESGLQLSGDQIWRQDGRDDNEVHDGMGDHVEAHDRFGLTLSAGDFDGDQHSELAIGVPYEDVASATDAGLVHVLKGTPDGLVTWPEERVWVSLQLGDPIQNAARFGYALGSGDANLGGAAELAIAAPIDGGIGVSTSGETTESDGEESAVYALHGTTHPNGPGWERWQTWREAEGTLESDGNGAGTSSAPSVNTSPLGGGFGFGPRP